MTVTPGVALITGAGSGMGRATAERFLAEGWTVLALDIAPVEIATETGQVFSAVADVRDRAAVDAALASLVEQAGGTLDVVANVAGVYPPSTLETYTEDLYRLVFDINVLGVINITAAGAKLLSDGGSIVNFASVDAFANSPGQLLYCASKAAVVMITKSTAIELAPRRIRVNAVAPGWIDTPGNRATGRMDAAAASIPLGRVGQASEIAEWVWILTGGGHAGYMTGETINLSGGDVMR
ncbi:SDR family NAD(P)-dependent oxidoreductase [Agreia sp. PsM10]|uniref:SDR family NAD(P)-dependent oxidoreductase n=1 Tax=Agreia sp. PsM10 TaxID=3030533 RepID=UPI00263A8ED9|nr:SDR family oxidoreductase [Agreia sp. PsM10]MDN4641050.1 SDR family NAD(P)-dependent oxidoreductase [Agreia sp. PsM10]